MKELVVETRDMTKIYRKQSVVQNVNMRVQKG